MHGSLRKWLLARSIQPEGTLLVKAGTGNGAHASNGQVATRGRRSVSKEQQGEREQGTRGRSKSPAAPRARSRTPVGRGKPGAGSRIGSNGGDPGSLTAARSTTPSRRRKSGNGVADVTKAAAETGSSQLASYHTEQLHRHSVGELKPWEHQLLQAVPVLAVFVYSGLTHELLLQVSGVGSLHTHVRLEGLQVMPVQPRPCLGPFQDALV